MICGILLGILLGNYAPEWLYRILLTFQSLFSNFLKFAIPLIMMGLIMPSIADLGKNAGKLLLITVGIAYVFTLFSGFSTYLVGEAIFPSLLQGEQLASLAENSVKSAPYFTIEMPPLADVMSALVLSFIIGIGLSFREETKLTDVIREFGDIIKWLIVKAIIPILPFYILCIFAEITYSGQVLAIMEVFFKLIVILFVLLIIQYLIAGGISGKNPFKALGTMLPAYATALGTQSSAATIPVTLRQSLKLGISQRIAGFVIPLCATIHLSGSTMKITACALALMMIQGVPYDFSLFAGFILMLGVVMIAAPGVPGGAIMATLGVLNTILGFDESLQGLMVALYIAMDSFGTACNVTGDGAVALIVDKIAKREDSGERG